MSCSFVFIPMSVIRLAAVVLLVSCLYKSQAKASSAIRIKRSVNTILDSFYREIGPERALAFENAAAGILVFPNTLKAGLGFGGEYGEGALRVGGQSVRYFNMVSASVGFQAGVRSGQSLLFSWHRIRLKTFSKARGGKLGLMYNLTLEGSKITRIHP